MWLTQEFAGIDAKLDGRFMGVIPQNGLPSKYNPMVTAFEYLGQTTTMELINTKLLTENARMNLSGTDSALLTKKTWSILREGLQK